MRKFGPYRLPPWLRSFKNFCSPFIIPISIFQGIRTILIPTTFDVLLFTILVIIALAIYLKYI